EAHGADLLGTDLVAFAERLGRLGGPALVVLIARRLAQLLIIWAPRLDLGGHVRTEALRQPAGRLVLGGQGGVPQALGQEPEKGPVGAGGSLLLLAFLGASLPASRDGLFLLAPQRVDGHDVGLRDSQVPTG